MSRLKRLIRVCQVNWHRPRHWRLRPRTIDRRVFLEVAVRNEYRLPRRFDADDVIVDVGAHLGSFTYAALRRGAGRVYCCEANGDNYQILRHNLAPYRDRVVALRAAVWRSDTVVPTLYFSDATDRRNTGAGSVTDTATGQEVPALALDDLLRRAAGEEERRIRLLKLDCEGAEWPILLTSRRLAQVDALCVEYHLHDLPPAFGVAGYPAFTPAVLDAFLREQGFRVRLVPWPRNPGSGLFFGSR
jgi:FkbM family methyltransferase